MDFIDRLSGRAGVGFNPDALFKFTPLSATVQQHLAKVYVTLAAALAVSAIGVFAAMIFGGLGGWVAMLGFLGSTVGLLSTEPSPYNVNKRYALLAGAAFSQGLSAGPLVQAVLDLHPSVLLTAFLGTATVFACFSAAALVSQRRSWLYLGGVLSSAISVLAVMRLASWFLGRGAMVFELELYGGLLLFTGYVLFDTQMIVEKAYSAQAMGTKPDHIRAALDLFIDFWAIFVRLLFILLRNAERREERDGRNRKRRP